jgi:hypothetical protein
LRIPQPTLPQLPESEYDKELNFQLYKILRLIINQLNGLTEGQVQSVTNATAAAPTAGTYQVGDVVRNSNPGELGSAGSKYILYGWLCTASPLTFKELHCLTGN